jgi:Tfp pilus assembly protein PilF
LSDYDRAIKLQPRYAKALVGRAQANLKKGEAAKGLLDIDRALSLDPDSAYVHHVKASILAALGRRDDAIAEYKKALALAPDLQESVEGLKALQRSKP